MHRRIERKQAHVIFWPKNDEATHCRKLPDCKGEEVATQAKFVPRGFLFRVALGRAPVVYTQCVCEVTIETEILSMQEARLS